MRTIVVVLGGVEYTVAELPVRKNAAWRQRLAEPFGSLVQALQDAPNIEIDKPSDLADLLRRLGASIIGSADVITELLVAYAPGLTPVIESDDCYDSEIQEAFAGVLGLAFPFSTWGRKALTTMQQINSLSASKPTSTN